MTSEGMALLPVAQIALDRMCRAHKRRTGCHLTREMISELSLTFLGEVWAENHVAPEKPHDP